MFFSFRNWLRRLFGPFGRSRGARKRGWRGAKKRGSPLCRRLCLETLEDRTLPSASATVSGLNVAFFSANIADAVYLQTSGNEVQWSSSGVAGSFSNLVALAPSTGSNAFSFQMSGPVYLENFIGLGGNLTFSGVGNAAGGFIGPSDLSIQGNLITQGGSLTVNDVQGVDIASNVVVSTRLISSTDLGNNNFTGNSVGNSGTINFSVANTDILNPTLYINFTHPHIELGSGASILAEVGSTSFTAGDVTLDVANVNYSLITQLFPELSLMDRSATITTDAGSTIAGNNVTLDAHAGDQNPLDALTGAVGSTAQSAQQNDLNAQTSAGLSPTVNKIVGLTDPFALPVSIIYKNATAAISIGSSTIIQASGAVYLESAAVTDAAATALFVFNTKVQASLALAMSFSDAETTIASGATITSAGDVTIQSIGSAVAAASATAATRTEMTPSGTVQVSAAIGITNITAHATVAQGATLTSTGGNVDVEADGSMSPRLPRPPRITVRARRG